MKFPALKALGELLDTFYKIPNLYILSQASEKRSYGITCSTCYQRP